MGEKRERQNPVALLQGFMKRVKGDHVGAYAAQAAYFLILSTIPFLLFFTTLIRYTPLTYNAVRDAIVGFVPQNLQSAVLGIVGDVYQRNAALVPLSALTALWSAGKGMQSITNGLNTIYHVKETRNWFMTRLYSVIYTLLFVIALIASLILLVLGNRIQAMISKYIPFLGTIIGRIIGARTFLVFTVLFFIFLVLYRVLPNRKASLKSQVPGALLNAIAWSLFSYFFSLYFEIFPNFSNMYGSMAALILVMLWLYVCMNIVLYCAEVNVYFEKQFRMAHKSMRKVLSRDREQEKQKEQEK